MSEHECDEEMTPEELAAQEEKAANRESMIQWILSEGLEPSTTKKNEYVHPQDTELNVFHDPYTEEVLMSRKLADRLAHRLASMKKT